MRDIVKIIPENRDHWLSLRSKDITSTESSALFGLSPYTTEFELFYRKQSEEILNITSNSRMKAGSFLEPSIAKLASSEIDCNVLPFKEYIRCPKHRMGSSFDYRITSGKYRKWILEIKNVDFLVYRNDWCGNEAPPHIEIQIQHQLELTKRPGAILAVLIGGNELKIFEKPRNEKMGYAIRKKIIEFWNTIEQNNPPFPDYLRDSEFIISLNSDSEEDRIYNAEGDNELIRLMSDYKRISQEKTDLAKILKSYQAQILEKINNASKVIGGGYKISCGNIADALIPEHTRKGYRNFKVYKTKD